MAVGKHTGVESTPEPGHTTDSHSAPGPGTRRWRRLGLVTGATVTLGTTALASTIIFPTLLPGSVGHLPWAKPKDCPSTVVEIVTAPVVEQAVTEAVAGVQGWRLPEGECLKVQVRAQSSYDTASGSAILPSGRAPQLWIADSSIWLPQVHDWQLKVAGSFGSTPIVLGSNIATAAVNGWSTTPPSWSTALDGSHPLAAPQLTTTANNLLTMQALWQTSGMGAAAEHKLAAALLAVSRTQDIDSGSQITLRAISRGGAGQPLVPSTEQSVLAVNQDSVTPNLVALYPTEGSPILDFPIVRIAPNLRASAQQAGTDVVVAALSGTSGRRAAHRAGLRDPNGTDPPTGAPPTIRRLTDVSTNAQAKFLKRLVAITSPTRVLVCFDVSASMATMVPGTTLSRLQVAMQSANTTGSLLADNSAIGIWLFARNLDGSRPYREISPIEPMGNPEGRTTHRIAMSHQLLTIQERPPTGSGTGLYETALAAVRTARAKYDPKAMNVVVLFTDGKNDYAGGRSLAQTVQELRADAAANSNRPVRLVGIAIGPDADLAALKALTAPTGGLVFQGTTVDQLQQQLYEGLSWLA
jgi:Ca-activated chloride channel family protein